MTNVQFDEQKETISFFMAMAITERLGRDGLLEKAAEAETEEAKLEAVKEGAEAIKDECEKAFKTEKEYQRQMKAAVLESLLRHHYHYHGFDYDTHEAGE